MGIIKDLLIHTFHSLMENTLLVMDVKETRMDIIG